VNAARVTSERETMPASGRNKPLVLSTAVEALIESSSDEGCSILNREVSAGDCIRRGGDR